MVCPAAETDSADRNQFPDVSTLNGLPADAVYRIFESLSPGKLAEVEALQKYSDIKLGARDTDRGRSL